MLSGTLADGNTISVSTVQLDNAQIVPFEVLTQGATTNSSTNYAVVGNFSIEAGASIGELLVANQSRVNIFGGSIDGDISLTDEGEVWIYSNSSLNINGRETVRVFGTLADGTLTDFNIHREGSGTIREMSVLRDDLLLEENFSLFNTAIMDGPEGPTSVNVVTGVLNQAIETRQNSILNYWSGVSFPTRIDSYDESQFNVINGTISGDDEAIFAHDNSEIKIIGGNLTGRGRDGVRIWDNSSLEFRGGTIIASDDGIDVKHSGRVFMEGGTIQAGEDGIKAKDNSIVRVLGGIIEATEDGISADGNATITIAGSATEISGASGYGLNISDDATARISGGRIGGTKGSIIANDNSVVDVFGGTLVGNLFTDGGTINLYGDLQLNGNRIIGTLLDGTEIDVQTEGSGFILAGEISCDLNQDFLCDVQDIDDLLQNLGSQNTDFDIDGSGIIDIADRDAWLVEAEFQLGDFNFDGTVDSRGLNIIGINWQSDASSYAEGDADGDGRVAAIDLNAVGINWNPAVVAAAVPEPAAGVSMLTAMLFLLGIRRRMSSEF